MKKVLLSKTKKEGRKEGRRGNKEAREGREYYEINQKFSVEDGIVIRCFSGSNSLQ